MSLNRVTLVGRIGKSPELRSTSGGKSVCSFTIAVQKRVKSSDGTDCDWFRVTAWGQTAEYVNTYLTKGRLVSVDGRLDTRKWKDKDGNEREGVEIVADNVNGLDKPKDDAQPKGAAKTTTVGAGADDYSPWDDE